VATPPWAWPFILTDPAEVRVKGGAWLFSGDLEAARPSAKSPEAVMASMEANGM